MESLKTNLDLFVLLKSNNTSFKYEVLFNSLSDRLGDRLTEEDSVTLKEFCQRFSRAARKRYERSGRNTEAFRLYYGTWLESNVDWPSCIQSYTIQEPYHESDKENDYPMEPSTSCSVGTMTKRSRKPFEDLGTKQKKRRSDEHKTQDPNELAFAAAQRFKETGDEDMAYVIEHLLKNPEAATQIKQLLQKPTITFSPEKALGLLLSLKMTKWQYKTLRERAIHEGAKNMCPSYYKVQQVKQKCYPPKQFISVTDSSARIKLQALLDITVKRILESLPDNVQDKELTLVSKWGFDGASNQSRYKQKMDSQQDDASIFMTSIVPLTLSTENETLWTNPKPCSTLYCRAVQFSFIKENETVVIDQKKQMDDEIKDLIATNCDNNNKVSHKLMMTMIDGKICTYLSEARSNATCYLCLAKPTEMNRLDVVTTKPITSSNVYDFGLSSLHARINSMELLLHVAYKLDFKKWAAKDDDHKILMETRKKSIQDGFKNELNLLIDIVKQGAGTTNDGNTARRFFEFPEKTAAITGLDKDLVSRFAVILQAITSGLHINVVKFKDYAFQTAEKYVELYGWYYMSSTVHKLLIHGADIIDKNNIVPIGTLSEEASEARNKDFRNYREHHSRKKSRQASNEDILNMFLLSSDPLLSSQRPHLETKHKSQFFIETLELLKLPENEIEYINVSNLDTDSELDSEEE